MDRFSMYSPRLSSDNATVFRILSRRCPKKALLIPCPEVGN
ncbi:hypothetical protein [Azospirillum largimobile]